MAARTSPGPVTKPDSLSLFPREFYSVWILMSRPLFAGISTSSKNVPFVTSFKISLFLFVRVCAAHLANHLLNFLGQTPFGASRSRLRFHDDDGGPPTAPNQGQLCPQEAIGASQLRSHHRPLPHTEGEQWGGNEGWGESPK